MSDYDNLPKTTHYDLNKPDYLNVADIFALNENFDIIDALFYGIKTTADNHYVDANAHAEAFSKHNTDLQAHSNMFADVNFYVATTGSDSNNGEEGTPFRTIQHAVDSIPQGCSKATINIANGTYNEAVLVYNTTTSIISFNGEDKNTTIVNSIQARENSIVSVSKITFNTTGSVSLLFHNTKGRVYDIIINGSTNTTGVYAYGADTDVEETAINNCLRATYNDRGFIQCQKVSGSGNTYAYVAGGGVTLIGNSCTLTATNFKMITSSGYVIEQAMATSLTTGVADSTTATTDATKKLVTTEFLQGNFDRLVQCIKGDDYIVMRYASGFVVQMFSRTVGAYANNVVLPYAYKHSQLGANATNIGSNAYSNLTQATTCNYAKTTLDLYVQSTVGGLGNTAWNIISWGRDS